ncbi:MAG: hypothetical protein H6R04_1798 [Burkholderiaceae bacterium]|nr:hypothetical protein [Burkholderiaceae bacterium]
MQNSVFEKTDKGREEIATRKHQLPPRLRSLLVMVDGKQTKAQLLKNITALGMDERSITELLDKQFIRETTSPSS